MFHCERHVVSRPEAVKLLRHVDEFQEAHVENGDHNNQHPKEHKVPGSDVTRKMRKKPVFCRVDDEDNIIVGDSDPRKINPLAVAYVLNTSGMV